MKKGIVYKIVNDINEEIYVGSTVAELKTRFGVHKCSARTEKCKDIRLYKLMNEIGFNHFHIEPLEEIQFEHKKELREKEGEYIRQYGTLNSLIAGRTKDQYRKDEKQNIAIRDKMYTEKNREAVLQRKKDYYDKNRDRMKSQMKRHYQNNIEEIREHKKEYYIKNREKQLEYKTEKILCCCGKSISRCNIAKHRNVCKVAQQK